MASRPEHSTVIRWCDFTGSDLHRFNDAVESLGNFDECGGLNRDADVYGNFMIFCNDDCIELDGGQQNVRCFDNRFESALCGVSIQGCMVSPVYLYRNGFYSMCEEFGSFGQTVKTGGGPHGEEAHAYICGNLLWGKGSGITCMHLLQAHITSNVFCEAQAVLAADCSPKSSMKDNVFGVAMDEKDLPTTLPVRPVGFILDRARFSGIRVEKGVATPEVLCVTATSTSKEVIPFEVRKNDDFPWLKVSPEKGVIPAGGKVRFSVSFDVARMNDRRNYRGCFLVRTPEGLSRAVSVYAETDFVPPFSPERQGEVAVRVPACASGGEVSFPDNKKVFEYEFTVPKDGRYHFMIHARKGDGGGSPVMARISASVDGEKFNISRNKLWPYPAWTSVAPGNQFGNMLRFWDFKAGERHVLRIKGCGSKVLFDALVLTDSPGSFEPR